MIHNNLFFPYLTLVFPLFHQVHQLYKNSELHILEDEGHLLNRNKGRLVNMAVSYLKDHLA